MASSPNLSSRRWIVLMASCAVVFCTGSIYTFSVLRDPLVSSGLTLSSVMLAYGINSGIAPIPMILGGYFVDRGGSRWLAALGLGLYGVGWLIAGFSTSGTMLCLSYGVIAGLGQGFAYAACLNNILRFFPDKRGLAAGLVTAANGGATIVMAPIAAVLIARFAVGSTMVILGIAFLIVTALTFCLIRVAPKDFRPAGYSPRAQEDRGDSRTEISCATMVTTIEFWMIFLMFLAGAFSGLMIAANAAPIAHTMWHLSVEAAVTYVSLYAFANMAGRIVYGTVADRLGTLRAVQIIFVVIAASLIVLIAGAGNTLFLILGLLGLGLCFGGIMGTMPPLVMETFGSRHQGINYGVVFSGYAVAAIFAPRLAASIAQNAAGDYSRAFAIAIGAACVGFAATIGYALARKRTRAHQDRHELV